MTDRFAATCHILRRNQEADCVQYTESIAAKQDKARSLSSLWQILVSVVLHAMLLLGLFLLPQALPPQVDDEQEIEVEIIPWEALAPPPPPAVSQPSSKAEPISTEPNPEDQQEPQDGMVRPSRMLSGSVLDQANNALARQALREIPADESREQLCTLEAMEQITAWDKALVPKLLLSYVFKDTIWQPPLLIAEGAAFMSGALWYYLSYECTLSTNGRAVEDFAFKVGDPVPKRLWDGYDLIETVHDSAKGIENYNRATRGE